MVKLTKLQAEGLHALLGELDVATGAYARALSDVFDQLDDHGVESPDHTIMPAYGDRGAYLARKED